MEIPRIDLLLTEVEYGSESELSKPGRKFLGQEGTLERLPRTSDTLFHQSGRHSLADPKRVARERVVQRKTTSGRVRGDDLERGLDLFDGEIHRHTQPAVEGRCSEVEPGCR